MVNEITFTPGDTIRIHQRIQEDNRTRIQVFEGIVLGIRGRGENKTFTVKKMVGDVAVEKILPVFLPSIEKVEIKSHSKKRVRRSKLNYLRS